MARTFCASDALSPAPDLFFRRLADPTRSSCPNDHFQSTDAATYPAQASDLAQSLHPDPKDACDQAKERPAPCPSGLYGPHVQTGPRADLMLSFSWCLLLGSLSRGFTRAKYGRSDADDACSRLDCYLHILAHAHA